MRTFRIAYTLSTALIICSSLFSQTKNSIKPPKNFVFVPAGVVSVDSNKVSLDAFFISKFEVSNAEYRLFLEDIKALGRIDDYRIGMIDSLQWKTPDAFNLPYVTYYHKHKAYSNYPVLNISHQAAILYCSWLTEKFNEDQKKKGLPLGEFRLPSINEWTWAAKGGKEHVIYSWGSPYLHDAKGSLNCCYKMVGDELITYNKDSKKLEIVNNKELSGFDKIRMMRSIPGPVDMFKPNGYGLFNMCGNVAEFVIEPGIILGGSWNSPGYDVRIGPTAEYQGQTGPSTFIGFRPVFVYKNTK